MRAVNTCIQKPYGFHKGFHKKIRKMKNLRFSQGCLQNPRVLTLTFSTTLGFSQELSKGFKNNPFTKTLRSTQGFSCIPQGFYKNPKYYTMFS